MKAISLWQPWASLMAFDRKKNETRGWATFFRGELAICAAKRIPSLTEFVSLGGPAGDYGLMKEITPLGCVVCVVEMFACIPTEQCFRLTEEERANGDYSDGRFAWMTRDCRRLKKPVPVVGRQGLFNLPREVEAQVRGQL